MKAVDTHAAPLAFSYDVAMTDACRGGGHAGKHALRQAGTNEAILLLTQACLIVIMVTILELSARLPVAAPNVHYSPTEILSWSRPSNGKTELSVCWIKAGYRSRSSS